VTPLKRQLRWQNPRPRIRTSGGRKSHNRPDLMHEIGRGERGPAAEAVADDSCRGGFELRFRQEIVEKKSDVRNAARHGSVPSHGLLFRSFPVSTSELGRDEFRAIQSRDNVAMTDQVIRQKCVSAPAAAAARMREKDDQTPTGSAGLQTSHGKLRLRAASNASMFRSTTVNRPGTNGSYINR
jgi:hypothetical protein